MTRFEKEISGMLGEYWMKSAKKDVEDAVRDANEKATVDADGAIKWKANDRYLMDDLCEILEYAGYNFSREATRKARDEQNEKFLAEYKANYKGPSDEELFEMRAAFGAGTTVVDVLSGKTINL